jgi:hypothetical protein
MQQNNTVNFISWFRLHVSSQFRHDFIQAIFLCFFISGFCSLTILTCSFFADGILISKSSLYLKSAYFHHHCIFCGMSRAFISISMGNIDAALQINSLSIFLYSVFTINSIFSISFLTYKVLTICLKIKSKEVALWR